jgi:hypothetical protein
MSNVTNTALPNPFIDAPINTLSEPVARDICEAIEAELQAWSESRPLFLRPGFAKRIDDLPYQPRRG